MGCEIQESGRYQPCRVFIKHTLAVEMTMSSVKTQAVIFRDKFGVNQHDKVLRKQQSLGLRLKKLFPNEDIIEEYFALHYRTDFTFKKHMLVVQMMKKDMLTEIHIRKEKDKKNWKSLVTSLLELILMNWIAMIMKYLVELVLTLLNQLKQTGTIN